MSDDLSGLFKAAARDEAAEAGREFPLAPAVLDRFIGHVRRRRATRAVMIAVGSAAAVGAVVLGLAQVWHFGPLAPGVTPSPSSSPSPSASPSPSPTPSPSPSATPSPSIEPSPSPSPTATATNPPPPPPAVPAAVSDFRVVPGGGSGEIVLQWTGTPDATGYRVYRTSAPGDPMGRSASFSVATGSTTVEYGGAYEFIQIWSPSPNTFEYVEAVDGHPGNFVVAAFNAVGQGPFQGTLCAVPLGSSDTC